MVSNRSSSSCQDISTTDKRLYVHVSPLSALQMTTSAVAVTVMTLFVSFGYREIHAVFVFA